MLTVVLKTNPLEVIFGIIMFIGALWFFNYLMAGISKAGNVTLKNKGRTIARPNDFDEMNQNLKDGVNKIANTVQKTSQTIKSKLKTPTTGDKIKQLQDLQKLFDCGIISEQEFEVLKSEILK